MKCDLTPTETEVWDLMAAGKSDKEIARELGISLHNAKGRAKDLRKKLGAKNRVEVARAAWRAGRGS